MRPSRNRGALPPRKLLLLLLLLLGSPAAALSIDEIEPLYFDGIGGSGFSIDAVAAPGLVPGYAATAGDDWIAAGNAALGLPIQIDQNLGTFHQQPAVPTRTNPIIADSSWRVRNDSAGILVAPLLVFVDVDPSGTISLPPPTGLDGDLLEILAYSFGGDDFAFGVVQLPDLAEGEFVDITVRYVVGGPLPGGGGGALPPLGVALLNSYEVVPEPTTALLLGVGLVLCRLSRQRRSG